MPLISVIIPTYNRLHRVFQAVESVLNQSFRDFELIVVDDGSTDGTAAALSERFASDIRLQCKENTGVSATRNLGAELGSGRYLAFLDSDDLWHPNKLQRQIDFHQKNPQLKISQTEEIWIRNERRVNPKHKHKKPAGYIFPQSLHLCTVSPSSVMIEKTLFEAFGGFDEQLKACEDYDLWLRITPTHEVGLIAAHLLTRFGGHADQLSQRFPAMDRFRLFSLFKLYLSGVLTDTQSSQAAMVIREKWQVLKQGAIKRGNDILAMETLVQKTLDRRVSPVEFAEQGGPLLLDDAGYQ